MAPQSGKEPVASAAAPKGGVSLQLGAIRANLPEHVFEKNLTKSVYYMIVDYVMWLGCTAVMYGLVTSSLWSDASMVVKALITIAFWNISGFYMWCLFVVGHDCGHGTFSEHELLNDIIGNLVHATIMVPYFPWRLSHARHHMYHNHVVKDYSHPWYTEERYTLPDEVAARTVRRFPLIRATFPLYGWFVYLYGMPDGSHFFPFRWHRLWRDTPDSEKRKCYVSTVTVLFVLGGIAKALNYDLNTFMFYYGVPLGIFGWWLVTVTYLQHHSPNTLVYDDTNWTFVNAAFETVDRTYGFGIDGLHHNITDGHVVHHLFYTKIPHYHLTEATVALKEYLKGNGLSDLYKHEYTYDFLYRVFYYYYSVGFSATLSLKPLNASKKEAAAKKEKSSSAPLGN